MAVTVSPNNTHEASTVTREHPAPPRGQPGAYPSLALEILGRVGIGVAAGWVLAAVGVVMVVVGYYEVSGTADVARQLSYFSSADVGGLCCLGAGAVLIISDHYRQLRRSVEEVRSAAGVQATAAWPDPASRHTGGMLGLVKLPASETVHAADCVFVVDKENLEPVSAHEAQRQGLRPCQVCAPSV